MSQTEHAWFIEQIATHLAGGLDEQEQARFAAHRAACPQCASQLDALEKEDQAMQAAFAAAVPGVEFEQKIIAHLRKGWTPRVAIHPMVRRAAAGVAAALVLGALGYVANSMLSSGQLPQITMEDSAGSTGGGGGGAGVGGFGSLHLGKWSLGQDRTVVASNTRALDESGSGDGGRAAYNEDSMEALKDRREVKGLESLGRYRRSPAASSGAGKLGVAGGEQVAFGLTDKEGTETSKKEIPYDDIYRYPQDLDDFSRNLGRQGHGQGHGARGYAEPSSAAQPKAPTVFYGTARPDAPVSGQPFKPAEQVAALSVIDRPNSGALTSDLKGDLTIGGARITKIPVAAQDRVDIPWAETNGDGDAEVVKGNITAGRHIRTGVSPAAGNVAIAGDAQATPPAPAAAPATPVEPPADAGMQRKIIRNGQMEFEVESFDSAFMQISKIAMEERGFVASTESEKLANGKMTGTVVLRVPPEHLDTLVLKLRALGDLKNQKIVAQDITKQYTDLESQLRAARAMEQRLLEIIKTGKGEIKDLVAAEKELGVWREKIEQVEGEIRYYASQIALSTLRITLSEKDVKAAAFASETELRNIGIETEDVEKAYASAQELVNEFKGRIVGATLKKLDAGQFAASIACEVAPDSAGPMTDRLKQLGKVARMEAERKQTPADGAEAPISSKIQRKDTRFTISLYNLANIAPRETTTVNLACRNVDTAYRAILARVAKAGGRVVGSNLNQLKADQTTATISFQVRSEDAAALLEELHRPGGDADTELTRLTTTENTDTANVTAAKRGFAVQIVSLASVAPRETITLQLAAPAVPEAYKALTQLLADPAMQSRILSSQLSEQDRRNVTGSVDCEIRRSDLPALDKALAASGEVFSRNATRATDTENTIDSKVRLTMTLIDADNLAPREVATMGLEAQNVEKTMGDLAAAAAGLHGHSVETRLSKEPSGRVTGHLVLDVPLVQASNMLQTVREQTTVRAIDTARNTQVPAGALARTRIDMTLSNAEGIVSSEQGVWATVRHGLATSVAGLLWSLQLIVIGLCMIGPWVLAIWAIVRLARRGKRKATSPAA